MPYLHIDCTARAHNIGVENSHGEWILKQDIDCIAYRGFYTELIDYLNSKIDYLIIGCKYLSNSVDIWEKKDFKNHNQLENNWNCGNLYCVKKDYYILVGGEPEGLKFLGEDYYFEYKIHKLYNPEFEIKGDARQQIKNQIVIPKNQDIFKKKGFAFLHNYHKRDFTGRGDDVKKLNEMINGNCDRNE